jgi:hypothetical protein
MASSGSIFKSDLPNLFHVVQNDMMEYPKAIIIDHLRDHFSYDSIYHYVKDEYGFAETIDHTNLPLTAGLNDNTVTRLFIGETFRQDGIMYPAILVKHGGAKSVPISINREKGSVQWDIRSIQDGYGNVSFYRVPKSFILAGAWEGSITIDIKTRSLRSRDDLGAEVMLCMTDILYESLKQAGVVCKLPSISATTETDDRNDKVFSQTVTVDIRNEWRRELPVENVVDVINFSIEFGRIPNGPIAPNLTINTNATFIDIMNGYPATPITTPIPPYVEDTDNE